MKTKNNTFKRIAAGALATISVATNVMSANVGGSPFVDAIRASLVAQAAVGDDTQVDFTEINKYLTSFSNGTTTFDANALSGLTSFKAKEGDTITVKSSIPLTFNKEVTGDEAYQEGAIQGADQKFYKLANDQTSNYSYDFKVENDVKKANVAVKTADGTKSDTAPAYSENVNEYKYYLLSESENKDNIEFDGETAYYPGKATEGDTYAKVTRVEPANGDTIKYTKIDALNKADTFKELYTVATDLHAYKINGNNVEKVTGEFTATEANSYKFYETQQDGLYVLENGGTSTITKFNSYENVTEDTFNDLLGDSAVYYLNNGVMTSTLIFVSGTTTYYKVDPNQPKETNAQEKYTKANKYKNTSGNAIKYSISAMSADSKKADFAGGVNAGDTISKDVYDLIKAVVNFADADKIAIFGTENGADYNAYKLDDNGTLAFHDIFIRNATADDYEAAAKYHELTEIDPDNALQKTYKPAIGTNVYIKAVHQNNIVFNQNNNQNNTIYEVHNKVDVALVTDTIDTETYKVYEPALLKDDSMINNYKYYKAVKEADNGVTEAAALKAGEVYATKSGNSFVYTYKVTSAVKIVGQKTKVEITNGLPGAYTTVEAYNQLEEDKKPLYAWGDTTDNALLKGARPVVSDLKFVSDMEHGEKIAEYDGTVLNPSNVTDGLDAYKNENVVLSSSNYFKVRIWDGNQKTAYKEYATKFNSKTNRWECTFPAYVEAKENITKVLVEKADPVYTYTTDGSVLSVSGSGIDSEAAYIKAYAVSKADAETNGQGKPVSDAEKKKYAITSNTTQSYGSSVYVDIERIAEFASAKNSVNEYSTLKITRNGNEITGEADDPTTEKINETVTPGTTIHNDKYDAIPENDSINRAQNFTFNQPGEYEITYTVYINANKTTAVAKELKFKFTIDTQAKLTASNAKLTFYTNEENVITGATKVIGGEGENNNTAQFPGAPVGSYAKVVTGAENLKLPVDVEDLKNKSINVTATLVNAQGEDLEDIKVILSGATTVNELNLSQPLYITYNNDQYSTGSETIVVNWQAVSKAKQFNIFQPNGETPLYKEVGGNYEVNVSIDEIADIQKIVESNYVLKNGDAKKISYEYSVGKGDKLESQELDWHEAGFPKEIGEYSLYILYANEPIAVVDLNVIKHSLHAAPTEAQLNITYGDKLFTEEELGYADAEGNAVKDATVKNPEIKFYATTLLDDTQVKQIVDGKFNGATVYEKDGKYYTTVGNAVENPYNAPLNAGVYVAEIKAKNGNATTVGKADYTLMSDTFVLNVAKKQITADMITIAPKNYIADYHTIGKHAGDIVGKDTAITKNFANAPTAVKLKIASGEQSGKNIGGYTVNVTVADNEQNYTGTVKNFKWYIIKGAEKDGENYSGLFWNDTETTIVDNGNINVEFGKSANLVGEVVEFGFIGDKSGKIGAPTKGTYTDNKSSGIYNYSNNFDATIGAALNTAKADPNVQAAYSELVYGAGINPAKQNAAMIAKKGADTFGVSVRIEDANTGVWVRPYLILKVDGEEKLYYGEVRYLNLVEEATAMLNLKASARGGANNTDHVAQEAFTKDQAKAQHTDNSDLAYMEEARSGYWAEKNQFYAYAHYNFDKNSKVKDSAIQGFGVVLDKNGYIPALVDENGLAGAALVAAQAKNAEIQAKAKEVLIPANKGKNGILSGISKDNPKMLKNEMGVAVNPKDAVTGVWLRSFVDFGNGLIVYTDPVYIKSVSEQYADCKPGVEGKKADNAAKINYTVTANAKGSGAAVIPKFKGANAVIKEAGVVVDKNGTLFKLNDAGYYTGWVDDITTKFIADNATANGYNKGKKGIDINPATADTKIFTGHAFQVTNKSGNYIKTVARPFVVYTINGKDITIYGDPVPDETGDATYPEVAKS